MGKFILIPVVFLLSGFSGAAHTALLNVASIEFVVSSAKKIKSINLNEVVLTEAVSGNDLALTSAGATVTSSVIPSNKFFKNNPARIIDGIINKKRAYYFPKSKKGKKALPSLTINLAQLSDINSFNFFGNFGKAKKTHLGVDFLDVNGNSIYKIANLAKTFGKRNSGTYILPDLSGQASAVPLPASVWLFGMGLFGVLGMARKHAAIRSMKCL